jgi:hypothetical protein
MFAAAAAACFVAAGLVAFASQPAAATTVPPGSVLVKSLLSPASSANKSVRVNCTSPQVPLGGGALTAGGAHVIISEARPISDSTGDGFIVTAQEDQQGVSLSWTVQVFAFCAPRPPGYEVKLLTNPQTSALNDAPLAFCSPGKYLLGSGGRITGGLGQVDLSLNPNNSGGLANASSAFAKEDADGFAGNYQTTAYAICATQNVFFDFEMVRVDLTDSNQTKKIPVSCPTGFRATGAAGFTAARGTHVQFFRPNTSVAPSAIEVFASSSVSISGSWTATGVIYCAK